TSSAGGATTVGVKLDEVDSSGVTGLATLTKDGDKTKVTVLLLGALDGAIVLIHQGTCDNLDPSPAFLLHDLDASGKSETDVADGVSDLKSGPYAIAVHSSVEDLSKPIACGDIGGGG